jgi:hypothetical protein
LVFFVLFFWGRLFLFRVLFPLLSVSYGRQFFLSLVFFCKVSVIARLFILIYLFKTNICIHLFVTICASSMTIWKIVFAIRPTHREILFRITVTETTIRHRQQWEQDTEQKQTTPKKENKKNQ